MLVELGLQLDTKQKVVSLYILLSIHIIRVKQNMKNKVWSHFVIINSV